MRQTLLDARLSYREAVMVYPTFTSGSNFDQASDGGYDITQDSRTVTYTLYRCKARIKIIHDTNLIGFSSSSTGLEVGDYLLYFAMEDRGQLERTLHEKHAYIVVDGNCLKPNNLTVNGIGLAFDVTAHCKIFSPEFRATGL
jgi:hypothetical protein